MYKDYGCRSPIKEGGDLFRKEKIMAKYYALGKSVRKPLMDFLVLSLRNFVLLKKRRNLSMRIMIASQSKKILWTDI